MQLHNIKINNISVYLLKNKMNIYINIIVQMYDCILIKSLQIYWEKYHYSYVLPGWLKILRSNRNKSEGS